MVTVIHVVDTFEPTQSLPPVAAIPLSPSVASLRAWQGHGAVSYYKRSSPSLLQETQTHRSRVPRPCSTTALITHSASRPFCAEEAWETRTHGEWTKHRTAKP